jgi:hypothetical protein
LITHTPGLSPPHGIPEPTLTRVVAGNDQPCTNDALGIEVLVGQSVHYGYVADRDLNAARNILRLELSRQALTQRVAVRVA